MRMGHGIEAREILWVAGRGAGAHGIRHVILACVGYNWHVAVDLGYIGTQLCHF